jgi:coenzyme Q-binding protein COQ10
MPSFSVTRRVPFSPRQMFDLVAAVERYPEFLPLCEALSVRGRAREGNGEVIVADMTVGYRAIRETFRSRVRLDPETLTVAAAGAEGAAGPFRALENRWRFKAAPKGCDVEFFIRYEFKSPFLALLVGRLFDRAFRRYAEAFERRAKVIYATPPAAATSARAP